MSWTRRSVKKLKVGDIIAPEYNWCAPILKVAPIWNRTDTVLVICDPHEVSQWYDQVDLIWSEIVGPHQFGINQRPLFWDGPNDLRTAFDAARFP